MKLITYLFQAEFQNMLNRRGMKYVVVKPEQSADTDVCTCSYILDSYLISKMCFNKIQSFYMDEKQHQDT